MSQPRTCSASMRPWRCRHGYSHVHVHVVGRGSTGEHTVLAERALGRRLPPEAEIHHIDGNPKNNTSSNLVICENQAYHALLHRRARVVRAGGNPNLDKICTRCHAVKPTSEFHKNASRPGGLQGPCKQCHAIFNQQYSARLAEPIAANG